MHASSARDEPGGGTRPGVTWEPFGIPPETWEDAPEHGGVKWLHLSPCRPRAAGDRSATWLRIATVLLGLLAAGLFVVSLAAQYRYVLSEKHQVVPSVIEAIGLDLGMTIFSLLALALAWAGQSARVERVLIIVCALGSAAMNYAAANDGSPRSVAAYVMPPVFLAVVVDRVVAVVRRHVLGDADRSAWAPAGRAALYMLRFLLAAPSTATGLRRQVLNMTPLPAVTDMAALPAAPTPGSAVITRPEPQYPQKPARPQGQRGDSKTGRFLQLVQERYGELTGIDPAKVSRICSDLAPEVGLNTGSARAALRPLVLAAQNGHSQ
jgi:Protein of unknown function (DUF2637)